MYCNQFASASCSIPEEEEEFERTSHDGGTLRLAFTSSPGIESHSSFASSIRTYLQSLLFSRGSRYCIDSLRPRHCHAQTLTSVPSTGTRSVINSSWYLPVERWVRANRTSHRLQYRVMVSSVSCMACTNIGRLSSSYSVTLGIEIVGVSSCPTGGREGCGMKRGLPLFCYETRPVYNRIIE